MANAKNITKIIVGEDLYYLKDKQVRDSIGANNGIATLDSSGKVPSSQLPSYVDDVIEAYYYNDTMYEDAEHTIAITPETGKIYIDLHTNESYRWSGTTYVVLSSPYVLPTASANVLGGIKVGSNLSIDNNGVLSATANSQVQSDWNQSTSTAVDYIKNKPIVESAASGGTTVSLVTTGEKYIWNNKANSSTTLSGYGITNAYTKDEVDALVSGSGCYTPTLSSAPTSSTTTYIKDGVTCNFAIGQFCRVADASSESGYTFYQLQDLNNGSAAWTVFVVKRSPSYTPPIARVLTYNTSSQALLNAGSTSDGTIVYSSNGMDWSVTIPEETNAGTYTAYWKLIGDNMHLDVGPFTIEVTIAKADQTAPVAVGATVYYGSTATATASGGGGHGSIEWYNGVYTRTEEGTTTGIKARWSGDSNYNASPWSNEVSLVVQNAYGGHAYVDFGLPSGTKWATMNIGASSETGYGNYYMYGKGSRTYNGSDSIYTGTEDPLSLSVDTAQQVWGAGWHTPTQAQCQELLNECIWTWTTKDGINGMSVSKNGKSIFLPASGAQDNGPYDVGAYGYYWSSTPMDSDYSYYFHFSNKSKGNSRVIRRLGLTVRGVVG